MIQNSRIKFVFFGTDDFSLAILEELRKADMLPSLIVTMPDRPKGRGLVLTSPPAKVWASQNSIPVIQPEKLDSSFQIKLSKLNFPLFVVASYGLIIPKEVLEIPAKGTLNVHPSLLPKYRGATPIESQILNDEKEVGITIMLMDEQMDHGSIVAQKKLTLGKTINAIELQRELAEMGGKMLADNIPKWVEGKIEAKPQEHPKATYTKKFNKSDGEIILSNDPYKNFLKIQAFAGSVGTYFFVEKMNKKTRVGIKSVEFADGKLTITRVVPEGKKEMSYEEFLRGLR